MSERKRNLTIMRALLPSHLQVENHSRPNRIWIRDKQFKKAKRMPQDDSLAEMEEFSNDDKQLSRISGTRFIGEPMRLPSMAFIR